MVTRSGRTAAAALVDGRPARLRIVANIPAGAIVPDVGKMPDDSPIVKGRTRPGLAFRDRHRSA